MSTHKSTAAIRINELNQCKKLLQTTAACQEITKEGK